MKRWLFLAMLGVGLMVSGALRAEVLSPDNVTVGALKAWLEEKYGCKIDKDGDLIVNAKNGKIAIEVLAKAKAIRFVSTYGAYDKRSREEMVRLANLFNYNKRLLRISIDPEGASSFCDYYLLYRGGLDRDNFLVTVVWIDGLKAVWEDFVINGGSAKK